MLVVREMKNVADHEGDSNINHSKTPAKEMGEMIQRRIETVQAIALLKSNSPIKIN